MIETPRLILRRWREEDFEPFVAMCADSEVMTWLGGALDRADARAYMVRAVDTFERIGMGRLAITRRDDGAFLGICGLMPGHEALVPLLSPFVDLSWSLCREAWGCGYATEAARGVILDGFERLGLSEITAMTAPANLRSQAVMGRLGMTADPACDFDHPLMEVDDPLRRHLVYRLRR